MKLYQALKRNKEAVERSRTIAKIHISDAVYRAIVKEPVMEALIEGDDSQRRLLGCQLEVHLHQVDEYWFEDVNGQGIDADFSFRL